MTKTTSRPIFVRYTGLIDFNALYAAIIDWCKNYEYEWHEETYKHKVPSPKGAEQEWSWYAEKKITDYIFYRINMRAHGWEMTEVEIIKDGKKKALTNGRIEIMITGVMTTDWQKRWAKGRFAKFLGKVYEKMKRREIESIYWDNLYYRIWNLQAVMKKFFDMQAKWHEYKGYLKED